MNQENNNEQVITDPEAARDVALANYYNSPEYKARQELDEKRTLQSDNIRERIEKATKLGLSFFFTKSAIRAFNERLEHLRRLCFDERLWNFDESQMEFSNHHIQANIILDEIINDMTAFMRGDDVYDQNGRNLDGNAIRHAIMMKLYRQSKIFKKSQRGVPVSLLTPGTCVAYYIGPSDHDEAVVNNVVSNGVRSFVIETETFEESTIHTGGVGRKSFNTSFITKILYSAPGVVKINERYHRQQPFTRDVPKQRFNAKVKRIKPTPINEFESWKFSRPENWSSIPLGDGSYTLRRTKYYTWVGSCSIIGHLIEKISGHWDDVGVDTQEMLIYFHRTGVLRFTEATDIEMPYDVATVANRKRLKKAVRQNINRFRTPLSQRLKLEKEENDRMYAELSHDW